MDFLAEPSLLIALTFVSFIVAGMLQRRTGLRVLNPILVATVVIVLVLYTGGISYDTYREGACYIEFWLKPAIVALGVPLYRQLETIRKQLLPLLVAELVGCVAGVVSVVGVAQLLGASQDVVMSLAPKSVTTPIAIEIAGTIGGIPPLTAAVVVCTGIFGAMAGFKMMALSRVKSPMAQGLSMGTAAHAVGTAAAIETAGTRFGAFSSLGLIINGLFTALLTPLILNLMGYSV